MNTVNTLEPSGTLFTVFKHLKYEYLVAGITGGVISTLVLHPLDLIKIRLAVNDGHSQCSPRYRGSIHAFREIVRTQGYLALYQGVIPNIVGAGASWGSYFFIYNCVKTWMQDGDVNASLGPWMNMLAAANAGILTLSLTNPIWVVKTRLCLQYTQDVNLSDTKRYSGMIDALRKICKTEGIRGLYKGYVPGIFGVSHGAIQFMTYEELKVKYNSYNDRPNSTRMDTTEYIVFAAVSKLIAAAVTYPYQVLRARLQDHHHNYHGVLDCIKSIWRFERWRGYYKGISMNLIRVTPATVITFVVYEHVSYYLLQGDSGDPTVRAKA